MSNSNEAPASATVKIKSKGGFEYLFTLREDAGVTLLDKLEKLEKELVDRGYTPLAQGNGFSKPQVPTKPCPKHNVPMKEKTGKDGSKFYSHSQGTYPNLEYCSGKGFPSEWE